MAEIPWLKAEYLDTRSGGYEACDVRYESGEDLFDLVGLQRLLRLNRRHKLVQEHCNLATDPVAVQRMLCETVCERAGAGWWKSDEEGKQERDV
eukprot:2933237-Rhodomonas_salina.1